MNKFVFMCISTFSLLLPQALNAAAVAQAESIAVPSLCRPLDDTISEIRAIAKARLQFNEGWVRYLTEGKFVESDSEIDDEQGRVENYATVFLTNNEGKQAKASKESLANPSEFIRTKRDLFKRDALLYGNIVVLIDSRNAISNFPDCLYAYLHCLYSSDPKKAASQELRESYWFSSIRNKLNPYVQTACGYAEKLIIRTDYFGSLNISNRFIVRESNALKEKAAKIRVSLDDKINRKESHKHSSECRELFMSVLCNAEFCNFFIRIPKIQDRLLPCFEDFNPLYLNILGEAHLYLTTYICQHSYLLSWIQYKFLPLLVAAEKADLEKRKISRLLKTAESVVNNYQTNCCQEWCAHQKALEEAEFAERKRQFEERNNKNKKQQNTKSTKLAPSNNELKLEKKVQSTPHQAEAKATPAQFVAPQEEPIVVEAVSILEKDPEDYLSFEKIQSQEDQGEVAEEDQEEEYRGGSTTHIFSL